MKTKVILTSAFIGLTAFIGGNVYTAYATVQEVPKAIVTAPAAKEAVEELAPIETTIEPTITEEVAVAPVSVVETPVPVAPAIRSTLEIAADYPTMTGSEQLLACFNKLVALFPDRFTESVREQNIKGLTAFATSCSTGVNNANPIINAYGPNGAYFDSELAKSKH